MDNTTIGGRYVAHQDMIRTEQQMSWSQTSRRTLRTFVLDPAVLNPFAGGRRINRTEFSDISTRAYGHQTMALFATWRADRQKPGSTWIDAATIVQGPKDTIFSPFNEPLAKAEPHLAQVMLNGAMAQEPAARATSLQVLSVLYGLLPEPHAAQNGLMRIFLKCRRSPSALPSMPRREPMMPGTGSSLKSNWLENCDPSCPGPCRSFALDAVRADFKLH